MTPDWPGDTAPLPHQAPDDRLGRRLAGMVGGELREVLATADHCHGIVTRDGEMDACGKPPVAVIDARDAEDGCFWPACAYHANRYGRGKCVPLLTIARAAHLGMYP